MIDQLLISKKLFLEARRQHSFDDPISDGVAVSLLQDAVEIYIWTLIKDRQLPTKERSDFMQNVDLVVASGLRIPSAKLSQLNKARVGFKHYGNLPARRDVVKFQNDVHEFLVESCLAHFNVSFSEISTATLIRSPELQDHFKDARVYADSGDLNPAYEALGKARYLVFRQLMAQLPKMSFGASEQPGAASSEATLRELLLVAIHKIDLENYRFAEKALPRTVRMQSGDWRTNHHRTQYSLEEFERIYDFLVDLCVKQSF